MMEDIVSTSLDHGIMPPTFRVDLPCLSGSSPEISSLIQVLLKLSSQPIIIGDSVTSQASTSTEGLVCVDCVLTEGLEAVQCHCPEVEALVWVGGGPGSEDLEQLCMPGSPPGSQVRLEGLSTGHYLSSLCISCHEDASISP